MLYTGLKCYEMLRLVQHSTDTAVGAQGNIATLPEHPRMARAEIVSRPHGMNINIHQPPSKFIHGHQWKSVTSMDIFETQSKSIRIHVCLWIRYCRNAHSGLIRSVSYKGMFAVIVFDARWHESWTRWDPVRSCCLEPFVLSFNDDRNM